MTSISPIRPPAPFVRSRTSRADFYRRSLVAVVLGAAALFALLTQLGDNGIVSLWRLHREAALLERQVADLRRHNDDKRAALDALANDPETLERIARDRGFRRDGEEVLLVRPGRPESATEPGRVP